MERSSHFPEILDLSRKVGLNEEELRDDFLRTSERSRAGNIRKYKFWSCHGNLPSSVLKLENHGEVPTMRNFLNLACYSLRDLMPIRVLRYLRDVNNQDTYHVTYSVRERFPDTEFVYDKYGPIWEMNNILDYLVLVHRPADPVWTIGLEDGAIGTLALHHVLCELLNITKMALAAAPLMQRDNEDDKSGKLRKDNNVSKSLVTALVLTRVFLKQLIQMACAEERDPIVHLVCGRISGERNTLKAVIHADTIQFESAEMPPPEWQVLADLVPNTFRSSGERVVEPIFTKAVASCLEFVDNRTKFDFRDVQDRHDTTMLCKNEDMRRLTADSPRVRNFLDDVDDTEIVGDVEPAVHRDWRNSEENHTATIAKWEVKSKTQRIDGIKVQSYKTGMMVESNGSERFKLYNKDNSLAMVVEFAYDGLRIVRRGTLKDLVKRYIPFTEGTVMGNGGKFKDNLVTVSRGDPSDIANAVFAGSYGSRAAVWLLGKLAFSETGADLASPAVLAGRREGGIRIRTMLGRNVVRNLVFLTDYQHVYMFYPGVYGLKRLVNKVDYYECVDTGAVSTKGMKACKLSSAKEMM